MATIKTTLLSENVYVGLYLQPLSCTPEATEFGEITQTRMWANAQPDGRPAEHRWRPLFNAAKFS